MNQTKYPEPFIKGFEGWEDKKGSEGVFNEFQTSETDQVGVNILFALYDQEGGWDGESFVLFERNGELFEVHGSHCSCNGLEGQWSPEKTSLPFLIQQQDELLSEEWRSGDFSRQKKEEFSKWIKQFEKLNGAMN